MTNNFFNEILLTAESRITATRTPGKLLLDKNEQSDDIDMHLKQRVLNKLMSSNWNRYPASDYKDIEAKIADYCGVAAENIVLSSGSASIITTLLDYFALNNKKIIITQPSYSLFDYHCKTYAIKYKPWFLTSDLEFDYENMPQLDKDSVLIITSPNNPTGNAIDGGKFEFLLQSYPDSIIMLDAVYTEFSDTDFTTLINQYENLIVLRSFSKAFPVAGLRLGYLCAAPKTAAIIKKLILQFSITPFSLIFAKELLFDEEFLAASKRKVQAIMLERDLLASAINIKFGSDVLKVFPSEGNFLLIRIHQHAKFESLLEAFAAAGIKILNTSAFPLLHQTFRVSIGNEEENMEFYNILEKSLARQLSPGVLQA